MSDPAIAVGATVGPGKLGGVVLRFGIFFLRVDDCFICSIRLDSVRRDTCQFPSRTPTSVSYSVSPSHINFIIPPRAEPGHPSQQTTYSPPCPFKGHELSYESMATSPEIIPATRQFTVHLPLALPRSGPLKSKSGCQPQARRHRSGGKKGPFPASHTNGS